MNPVPFVSFVVITKNSAERIRVCLNSIVQIDYPEDRYEIIVVDGGSTDNTREIAEGYGARVITLEVHGERMLGFTRGAFSKSRNAGLSVAEGNFIAFVDDDASISRDWLMVLLKEFEDASVAAATGVNRIPESNSRMGRYAGVLPVQHPNPDSLDPFPFFKDRVDESLITRDNAFIVSTKAAIYRKDLLLEVGGFDETLFESEDPDMNAALIKKGYRLAFVPEAVAWHRSRQNFYSFARQQVRGGLGQAHNLQKYPEMFEIRWAIVTVWILLVTALSLLSVFSKLAFTLLQTILLGYAVFLVQYGVRAAARYGDLTMVLGVPLMCATWQLCWGATFIFGLFLRPNVSSRKKFYLTLFSHIFRNLPRVLSSYNRAFILEEERPKEVAHRKLQTNG